MSDRSAPARWGPERLLRWGFAGLVVSAAVMGMSAVLGMGTNQAPPSGPLPVLHGLAGRSAPAWDGQRAPKPPASSSILSPTTAPGAILAGSAPIPGGQGTAIHAARLRPRNPASAQSADSGHSAHVAGSDAPSATASGNGPQSHGTAAGAPATADPAAGGGPTANATASVAPPPAPARGGGPDTSGHGRPPTSESDH